MQILQDGFPAFDTGVSQQHILSSKSPGWQRCNHPGIMIFANSLGDQGLVHSNDFSFADTRRLLQVLQWDSGNRHVFLVDRVGYIQERFPDNCMGILPAVQLTFPGIPHLGRFISDNP